MNLYYLKEVFFICTKPWFGPQCQYSFYLTESKSFQQILRKILRQRVEVLSPPHTAELTCYIHIECDRGGSDLCLDWREVCDGRIDCINGGIDEVHCFQLEMNECEEDEYRCHNGLCISKVFLKDEVPQCLDQSDISDVFIVPSLTFLPYIFDHEEIACRTGSKQFSCGDGQCVNDYHTCTNKRHLKLINSISHQGDLSSSCWMMMMCLTKISNSINEMSCEQLLTSSNINAILQTCGELIQFPTVPILFGHIRFLYRLKDRLDLNINLIILPDYICYNPRLCDFLPGTYFFREYSCRRKDEFDIDWSLKVDSWVSLITLIDRYFRRCSIRYNIDENFSSLYHCQNSSKWISKHRIVDHISDCYLNDDEQELKLSCLLNDSLRFKCADENKCYSSVAPRSICPPSYLHKLEEIEFSEICDRNIQMYPLIIDGQNHTDETDCDQWPCNNYYTRCDGFWSCSNGAAVMGSVRVFLEPNRTEPKNSETEPNRTERLFKKFEPNRTEPKNSQSKPNRTEPNEFSFKTGKKYRSILVFGVNCLGICRHQNPLKNFDLQFWISKFRTKIRCRFRL